MSLDESSNNGNPERQPRGLFTHSRKKSKSLNNLTQLNGKRSRSPSVSPQPKRQISLLAATSGQSKLKGLKKKLHAFAHLSRSNSSINEQRSTGKGCYLKTLALKFRKNVLSKDVNVKVQNAGLHDGKKLQPAYSGTLVEGKNKKLSPTKDEMKKKFRDNSTPHTNNIITSSITSSTTNGNSSSPMLQQDDQTSNNGQQQQQEWTPTHRHHNSLDSEQYIVLDAVGYDDSYEEGSSTYETDEIDGFAPAEYTAQEIERLLKKIEKTREDLIRMQATKDECVKEYLKTADATESTSNLKTKMNFEKNNLKTNTSIQVLQKKLEKYQLQLKELEERGIHGPRRIIRAVQDSVRSGASSLSGAVTRPLESLNQFIKKDKKDASADNISITVTQNDDDMEQNYLNNYHNAINTNSNTSDEDNLPHSTFYIAHNHDKSANQSAFETSMSEHDEPSRVHPHDEKMNRLEKANEELIGNISVLKTDLERVVESLQTERYKNEQLQSQLDDMFNQWNDLTELHQNEMMGLKQEMDRTAERVECVEYRFSERSGDLEEAVDSCNTRIHKMEVQQQQQQQLLLSVDGYFEGSGNTKLLLSKFLSLVISIFAILLVVISTLSKIVMPFASTRMRVITTVISLSIMILLWRHSEHEFVQLFLYYLNELLRPLYNTIPNSNSTPTDQK